jgi:hypothetical protein
MGANAPMSQSEYPSGIGLYDQRNLERIL